MMHGLVSLELAGMSGPNDALPSGEQGPAFISGMYDERYLAVVARGMAADPRRV